MISTKLPAACFVICRPVTGSYQNSVASLHQQQFTGTYESRLLWAGSSAAAQHGAQCCAVELPGTSSAAYTAACGLLSHKQAAGLCVSDQHLLWARQENGKVQAAVQAGPSGPPAHQLCMKDSADPLSCLSWLAILVQSPVLCLARSYPISCSGLITDTTGRS